MATRKKSKTKPATKPKTLASAGYPGEFRTVEAGVDSYVRELIAARAA